MSDEYVTEGLNGVTVFRPILLSKTDAKRVLALCAEVEQAWKGYNTSEGFILHEDHRKARAMLDGVITAKSRATERHEWDTIIKPLVIEFANTMQLPINKSKLRRTVIEQYLRVHGLHLSDSGTFKKKVRNWLEEMQQ